MKKENKTKGKKERTKEKIFKTALTLFLEQGYDNTTVQEITEKAEVAKGTFFSHFPTKDAILTYLGEQRIEKMQEALSIELSQIQSAKDQILKLFDFLAEVNEENKKITKLVSYEILKKFNSPELDHEAENQLELKRIMENIIVRGQQTREFKQDFQPNYVADILIGIYFYTLLHWLSIDLSVSLKKEYRDRVFIVLGGIENG